MAFTYKSLDGWFVPGIAYFRKLQEHALQMEQEIAELKEQLAVSGSQALQKRAEKWSEKWQEKCIEVGELQKRLIELESQKDAEIMRLQYRAEYLEQQLEDYQAAETPNSQRKRNKQTGQFVTDIPKKQKMEQAYQMHNQGFNDAQIARKLNVTAETAKRYVADYSKQLQESWLKAQNQASQGVYR